MVEIINSIKNDKIKYLRKLYDNRRRKKEGKYILEGYRLINSALKVDIKINDIFVTSEFVNSKMANNLPDYNLTYITEKLMDHLADTVNPQGIIAVVDEPEYDQENFFADSKYILVLDRIQDPGNMGTLIRTAAAAGFDGVIALKGCVDVYNLKVIRSTAGAIFSLPVINKMELAKLINFKKRNNEKFQLVSADIISNEYYHQANYKEPLMLVIGNEANGVREKILKLSDIIVKIPVSKNVESLNAAVAGSLIMYRISRKKLV